MIGGIRELRYQEFTYDKLAGNGIEYRGRPILSAEQVEDIVAFLATLKE